MTARAGTSLALRIIAVSAGVAAVTVVGVRVLPLNSATIGFAFLLLVLSIASTWGFVEAACASVLSTLAFNFFFLPPVGTFTIADPQNWVALFTLLTTSLVASRLSAAARERASEAFNRQQDLERLYSFSRSILLIDSRQHLTGSWRLNSLLFSDSPASFCTIAEQRRLCRAGPEEFEGLDEQLRDSALNGTSFSDALKNRTITAVRLGAEPIASLALQGSPMSDAVVQGIANLVAIGLERAKAQDLAHRSRSLVKAKNFGRHSSMLWRTS